MPDREELLGRIERALDGRVRQVVESHGGGLLVDVDAAGHAKVTFKGRCEACPSAAVTMGSLVEPAVLAVDGVADVTRRGAVSPFAEARIRAMFDIVPRPRPRHTEPPGSAPTTSHEHEE